MINGILLCGGNSTRFKSNKLFTKIDGKEVALHSFLALENSPKIDKIVVVKNANDDKIVNLFSFSKKVIFVNGGKSRFLSCLNALKALPKNTDFVVIHDGARPFISNQIIDNSIDSAKKFGSGVAVINEVDSVAEIVDGTLSKHLDREKIVRIQTPQTFNFGDIFSAYQKAFTDFGDTANFSDDSVLYSKYVGDCHYVLGNAKNIKITYEEDIKHIPLFGVGYDIHKFIKGSGITLCGVKIPFDKSFSAHSDGDVPIHALMDSILSALGKKDIGHYFPVEDKKYDNISSLVLLNGVVEIVKEEKRKITNVTLSIIAEKPKLSPYIDEMKEVLANALSISKDKVGITVTTNEGVSLIGSGEGIVSFASVTMV